MLLIYFVTGSLIICWALWSCDCDYRLGFVVVWLAVWQSDILAMLGLCWALWSCDWQSDIIFMLGFVVMWLAV